MNFSSPLTKFFLFLLIILDGMVAGATISQIHNMISPSSMGWYQLGVFMEGIFLGIFVGIITAIIVVVKAKPVWLKRIFRISVIAIGLYLLYLLLFNMLR